MSGHGYPYRPNLSTTDMNNVLRSGAPLHWFSPFATLGEVRTARTGRMPYGLVHWYLDAEGSPRTDVRTFRSEEDTRWATEHLYRLHQEKCRCLAVFYWTPEMVNRGMGPDQ